VQADGEHQHRQAWHANQQRDAVAETRGFVLNTTRQAVELLEAVQRPNVNLQFDIYHVQREEGNITPTMREQIARIGHMQIADSPGRHQPGTDEINYRFVLGELDRVGYQGYVSLEYAPEPDTLSSLDWIETHGGLLE
jgi:hydroxypyruvate isomerase